MNFKEIKLKLTDQNFLILPAENLAVILSGTKVIEDKDTLMSDHIRILKDDDGFYVQELTNKNELSLRKMESEADAEKFVESRMETYEKMWDGCGCKVNYYE